MSTFTLLLLLATVNAPEEASKPRKVSWASFNESTFDTSWALPESSPWSESADLIQVMKRFASLRVEGRSEDPVALGDIILAVRGSDRRATFDSQLRRLRTGFSEVFEEVDSRLPGFDRILGEWICDGAWQSQSWDPDTDSGEDGILLWDSVALSSIGAAPWNGVVGSNTLQQAAILIFADLATIKEAEANYEAYPSRTGATYEAIYPRRGSYVVGVRPDETPFAGLNIYFRAKLPIPLMTYSCDLRIYDHLDREGNLVTNIHSSSPDFHWMAGRDVFLPVTKGTGEWVATLVVRQFGFDMAGLPDGDEDRQAAVRSTLGNLRREAEALFRDTPRSQVPSAGQIPRVTIRGWR